MIIAHFFKREIKHKTYLMADSSASKGFEPLYASPEVMFEITGEESTDELAKRATEKILAEHKVLVYVECLKPRKARGKTQVFDLVFKKNYEGRKSLLERITGK